MGTENSIKYAFVLTLHIAEHAHADMESGCKACGFGEDPYKSIDATFYNVIHARLQHLSLTASYNVPADETTGTVAFEGVPLTKSEREPESFYEFQNLVGKWPNKQERGQIERRRRAAFLDRAEARKERREKEEGGWIVNAVSDVEAKRKFLEGYGLQEWYFKESLGRLKGLLVPIEQGPTHSSE